MDDEEAVEHDEDGRDDGQVAEEEAKEGVRLAARRPPHPPAILLNCLAFICETPNGNRWLKAAVAEKGWMLAMPKSASISVASSLLAFSTRDRKGCESE